MADPTCSQCAHWTLTFFAHDNICYPSGFGRCLLWYPACGWLPPEPADKWQLIRVDYSSKRRLPNAGMLLHTAPDFVCRRFENEPEDEDEGATEDEPATEG